MFLQELDAVGFKSFADKTSITFLPPSATSKGITAVVGPNGSGKSNVADALRWVLGEQSIKLLRGKKAEDVIFSGSDKRPRSGFAEVTLTLNNEDGKIPLDYAEITVSRRVYRDGQSEYLINKNKVRLADVQLLLAQAQIGARSYSVIGQGAIDGVLVASPAERKEFFDEAAGVKQFQLKRHQTVTKLSATKENLVQAELLIAEIEPRLRSLSRQVKRLEERGALEEELHALRHAYYGKLWRELSAQTTSRKVAIDRLEKEWREKDATLDNAKGALGKLEFDDAKGDAFIALQRDYEAFVEERHELREREMGIRSKIEIAEQVQKRSGAPLPLSKIIEEISALGERQTALIKKLRGTKTLMDAKALADTFATLRDATKSLAERLERPAAEIKETKADPQLLAELADLQKQSAAMSNKLAAAQSAVQNYHREEQKKKESFFALQRGLQEKINAAHALERRLNDERVELARLDARRESLEQEIGNELGERASRVKEEALAGSSVRLDAILPQIQKLKYQLELIGGIDPESIKEYAETKERHDFLESQIADLRKATDDLDRVIAELDITIKGRSEAAFRNLNRDFDRYFKALFDGGHAQLIELRASDANEDEDPDAAADEEKNDAPKGDRIVGIDIHATPPGKKIKNITMLSGGERALVSIALICAIMTTNPSPFVVLDEVDAALDESNADRFAAILEELAEKTQFIVITHNRYTMKRANVLYGVTMGDDSVSKLLSVNLDDVGGLKAKREPVAA